MAWPWNKDNPPENGANQTKSEVDELVTKLTQHFDSKFTPLVNDFTALKTDFDALKAAAAEPPPRKQEPSEPPKLTAWTDDADRAFAERMGPVLAMQASQGARFTETEALRNVERDWPALVPEIKKHLNATALERKAAPDYPTYVENVISMVIGENARKSGLKMDGTKKTFYLEDSTSRTTAERSPFTPEMNWIDQKGRTHTAEETLTKLGIVGEDAAKFAKERIQ